MGRWLNGDPIGEAGGLNLYHFNYNSPINYVDPDGAVAWLLLVPAAYVLFEFAMTGYDAYETGKTLLDPCASQAEKAIASGFFVAGMVGPGGGYNLARKGIQGLGKKVASGPRVAETASDAAANWVTRPQYWRISEFQGTRIYNRDDLLDVTLVDSRGRTNLERMRRGLAPIGPDGRSLNLHHTTQSNDSALAELTATFHQQNSRVIHINPSSTPSGIDRRGFDSFRRDYWKDRVSDFTP